MNKTLKVFKMIGFAVAVVTGVGLVLAGNPEQGFGIIAASVSSITMLESSK